MKFTLSTSGIFYPKQEIREKLQKLGFKFKKTDSLNFIIEGCPEIEIHSLEELIELSKEYGGITVSDGLIEIFDTCPDVDW
jgi:hypothetical protein